MIVQDLYNQFNWCPNYFSPWRNRARRNLRIDLRTYTSLCRLVSPVVPLRFLKGERRARGWAGEWGGFSQGCVVPPVLPLASMSPRQSDRAWSTRPLYTPCRAVPLANGGGGGNPPSQKTHIAASPPRHATRWLHLSVCRMQRIDIIACFSPQTLLSTGASRVTRWRLSSGSQRIELRGCRFNSPSFGVQFVAQRAAIDAALWRSEWQWLLWSNR